MSEYQHIDFKRKNNRRLMGTLMDTNVADQLSELTKTRGTSISVELRRATREYLERELPKVKAERDELSAQAPPRHLPERPPCQRKASAMSEQATVEQIRDTLKAWVDGKVDAKTFDKFIKTSNASLDAIIVEKAKEQDRWFRVSTRYIEV